MRPDSVTPTTRTAEDTERTGVSVNRIEGRIRNYAWGSRTALAEITGRPVPTEHPEAELWFGAHPGAPCDLVDTGETLEQRIAEDPEGQLGHAAGAGRLPFLLKILAADRALSLQAHPTVEQAKAGYARENADGVPVDSSQRNYKDDNHKPELIVALTPFEALAGFRPVDCTRELFAALQGAGATELSRYSTLLGPGDDGAGSADPVLLRALATTWITLPATERDTLLSSVLGGCESLVADSGTPDWIAAAAQAALDLSDQYPGDSGVLISLLLNHVVLAPGEAVFLSAGKLHAYLKGTGVEIMANSDNVLRGGLTSKHIDVPELMKVVDFSSSENQVRTARADGSYVTPVPEFALRVLPDGGTADVEGPAIVLATAGDCTVSGQDVDGETVLRPGQAAWVPADAGRIVADGSAQFFVATVG
ncbi:MAG TPA: mannose-6-phosphate isomerase, class I [Candidatus Corynebacterium avicola]|uniref:mannose-6-phosphate isomerase n=1 Tax=Candidatus Corynebacterium avicola TaxID=2838527 RepID=A0A9D1RRU7_9CORY|nr:mannose-6-phosphate isomerase, class I [Candidatus Corynebacterium avicola]